MDDIRKTASGLIQWMEDQAAGRCEISESAESNMDCLHLKTEFAQANVAIYYLEYTICELRVVDHRGENVFYLHFELNDIDHAKSLYTEMLESLLKQKLDNDIHVLLCCTCGLTTSFFTMKLNEAASTMDLKIDFEAVPYDKLYETAASKDLILLAPQIGYQLKNAQEILTDKTVMAIPAAIFSSYDVFGLISFARDNVHKDAKEKASGSAERLNQTEKGGSVLLVSVINMERRTQLAYRVYDGHDILMEKQIVKETYAASDILDVIATVLTLDPKIETVGVVSPGSFIDGKLTYEKANIFGLDIRNEIEQRFKKKTVVLNDTDAMALGYSIRERKGEETAFYFLPSGEYAGNIGMSENGMIFGNAGHMGGSQLAGITDIMTFPKNPYALAKTPEGNVILAARYIAGLITFTGCAHVAYYAKMIPDTEALKKELETIIRREYIPEIVKVASIRDYLYDGAMYYIENRKDQ